MGEPDESGELLRRASTGDGAALEELLARHLPGIEGFVALEAGAFLRAHESVRDLAQSVCREALERLRDGRFHFQGEAQFKSWLYRAAVMKVMNKKRFWLAERRDPARVEGQEVAHTDASASGGVFVHRATPSEDAAFREEIGRFVQALGQLPEAYREMIALHHVEGLSHAEIAARKGVSPAYSRVLLARALARLARLSGGSAASGPEGDGSTAG